jgi:hypothetical protein
VYEKFSQKWWKQWKGHSQEQVEGKKGVEAYQNPNFQAVQRQQTVWRKIRRRIVIFTQSIYVPLLVLLLLLFHWLFLILGGGKKLKSWTLFNGVPGRNTHTGNKGPISSSSSSSSSLSSSSQSTHSGNTKGKKASGGGGPGGGREGGTPGRGRERKWGHGIYTKSVPINYPSLVTILKYQISVNPNPHRSGAPCLNGFVSYVWFVLFCIPKPIHRPDLVPIPPLPVQVPKEDKKEDKWVWLSGISTWAVPPSPDAWLSFFSFPGVQSRILRDEILFRIFSDWLCVLSPL